MNPEDSPATSPSSSVTSGTRSPMNSNSCTTCSKIVYPMDLIKADEAIFHKSCLRCNVCNGQLKLGNYASLEGKYYCKPHFKQTFALKGNYKEARMEQTFQFKQESPSLNENFLACEWILDPVEKISFGVAGGDRGIIKCIDARSGSFKKALIGHGGSINHLCRHPTVPYILASASADNSVRLWNVVSSECLAVIGGDVGHKEQVLCVDFSPCGQFLVTGSIDTAVKIWPISSCLQGERGKRIPFIHHPIFSANYLFHSYIDSIKFMGNLLFVKSTTSKIMFIEPVYEKKPIISNFAFSEVQYICDFVFTHGNLWFMRLSISPNGRFLAVGNEIGEIFVWDLRKFNMQNDQDDNVNLPILHCKFSIGSVIPVREIIFCKDALLASADDSCIYQFQLQ